ncbi:ribosome small subunit-dependent GTPase A [Mesomycoplasma neurolyticum]|uniref:Small ribosomal subunit biogenesis GTPase RsgA n=1 Tax=Mesomycoplasma neurolyticum TaxID=2120 RepID=A0A449A5L8_9BACT|nr:ribosome small subunit-dependent GTPase A [Mesomycoplasma neurolyticum]VEU59522.1 Putative ribosome biogenesis GTPase rsgA [Mesomycoplasma neurolyticum]
MKGQVVRVIAGFYDVLDENKIEHRLRGSGKLRQQGVNPVVGDIVEFSPKGFVEFIFERKNFFVRPKIANVDQVIIVCSIEQPKFSSLLLDKFLLIAESKNIKPIIIITKVDLVSNYKEILSDYIKMNYEIYFNNNKKPTEEIINQLKNIFKDKISVFMGQTGVGKTTTINLLSNKQYETNEISFYLNRGKHTTRVVQIVDWNDGQIIDTPGFSFFEIDLDKNSLAKSFKIFQENLNKCKFNTCLHYKEETKNCEIKKMVEQNSIPEQRYENYLFFLKKTLGEIDEKN